MAIYPCQFGQHRYSGRQSSAYCTAVNGAYPASYKARLCPEHMAELVAVTALWLSPVGESVHSSLVCEKCDGAATSQVYMTLYAGQEEGASYVGDFCATHDASCLKQLRIDSWAPR